MQSAGDVSFLETSWWAARRCPLLLALNLAFFAGDLRAQPATQSKGQGPRKVLILCEAPLDGPTCAVTLPSIDSLKQDSITVSFSIRLLSQNGSDSSGLGLRLSNRKVTITASVCCVFPVTTTTDTSGRANIAWTGIPAQRPVGIQVWIDLDSGIVVSRLITISWQGIRKASRMSLVAMGDTQSTYRNDYLPKPVVVGIRGVTDQSECEHQAVHFVPYLDGKTGPDTALATWAAETRKCEAEGSWKLADAVGYQFVLAELAGPNGRDVQPARVVGYAREPARLVAAVAGLAREPQLHALFGVETPLFTSVHWLRVFVGTTFNDPSQQIYVGILVWPVINNRNESLPFQLNVGTRVGPARRVKLYAAISYDASSLITAILKAIPGGAVVGGK